MSDTLTPDGKITGPRGATAHRKWEPKEWTPLYETVVALSCTGLDNKEVGRRTGYGPQQVSNILNTPQGKKLREIIAERLRDANTVTLADRIERLQDKALKHIEYVLEIPTADFKNPLTIFDRSVSFLQKTTNKHFKPEAESGNSTIINNTNNIKAAMILTPSEAGGLIEGLHKANEVKQLHDGSISHNSIVKSGKPDGF